MNKHTTNQDFQSALDGKAAPTGCKNLFEVNTGIFRSLMRRTPIGAGCGAGGGGKVGYFGSKRTVGIEGLIRQGVLIAVLLGVSLVLASTARAASFDCGRAGTIVEHLICDNPELSELDDELSVAYKTALKDEKQAEAIKHAQKKWIKERDTCSGTNCLVLAYQSRIDELVVIPTQTKVMPMGVVLEEYALVMSKNDEMCNHMRQLMNVDLKQFKRTYDSHDRFVNGLEDIKSIPWKPARASFEYHGRTIYTIVEGALFDLNNDGVQDFVVRDEGMLSGMQADGLYMLDSGVASRANALKTKDFFDSNNQIAMAGWFYNLSVPLVGRTKSLWRLSPFTYHGVSYVYMQSLYKKDEAIGGDFVVIAKYIGGKFAVRDTTGNMEDICYIERVDLK